MIRLPRKHIADSVSERIIAVTAKLNANSVMVQGQNLSAALKQPVGDVAPIEGVDEAVVGRSLGL